MQFNLYQLCTISFNNVLLSRYERMGQISFDPLPFEISHHSQMFKQSLKGTNKFLSVCQKTTSLIVKFIRHVVYMCMRNVEMIKLQLSFLKNYYLSSILLSSQQKNLVSIKRSFQFKINLLLQKNSS